MNKLKYLSFLNVVMLNLTAQWNLPNSPTPSIKLTRLAAETERVSVEKKGFRGTKELLGNTRKGLYAKLVCPQSELPCELRANCSLFVLWDNWDSRGGLGVGGFFLSKTRSWTWGIFLSITCHRVFPEGCKLSLCLCVCACVKPPAGGGGCMVTRSQMET